MSEPTAPTPEQGPTALSFFTGYMGAAFALVFTSTFQTYFLLINP